MPYHEWAARQDHVDFWTLASSWSVFWQAVWLTQYSDIGLDNWPHLVDHPIASDPVLFFLDVSHGYIQWDWQIELLYTLCHPARDAAQGFRKDWNAGRAGARQAAEKLFLPGGKCLLDVLKNRARPGGWQAVRGVPVYAATALLQGLAAQHQH